MRKEAAESYIHRIGRTGRAGKEHMLTFTKLLLAASPPHSQRIPATWNPLQEGRAITFFDPDKAFGYYGLQAWLAGTW